MFFSATRRVKQALTPIRTLSSGIEINARNAMMKRRKQIFPAAALLAILLVSFILPASSLAASGEENDNHTDTEDYCMRAHDVTIGLSEFAAKTRTELESDIIAASDVCAADSRHRKPDGAVRADYLRLLGRFFQPRGGRDEQRLRRRRDAARHHAAAGFTRDLPRVCHGRPAASARCALYV